MDGRGGSCGKNGGSILAGGGNIRDVARDDRRSSADDAGVDLAREERDAAAARSAANEGRSVVVAVQPAPVSERHAGCGDVVDL